MEFGAQAALYQNTKPNIRTWTLFDLQYRTRKPPEWTSITFQLTPFQILAFYCLFAMSGSHPDEYYSIQYFRLARLLLQYAALINPPKAKEPITSPN